jgi:AcrR family transcriptional regulator
MQDRRVRRTQRLLAEALIALTLEKGYEAVTIRDITERADIGYATFFRHYRDKDALLAEALEVVLAELIGLLNLPADGADPAGMGTLLFRYVQDHAEICRALLGSRGATSFLPRILDAGAREVLREHTAAPGSPVPVEVAAHHLVAATLALIQWWLEHDMSYSPERMGVIYRELIARPTSAVAFADGVVES